MEFEAILTEGGAGGRPECLNTEERGDRRSDLLPCPIWNGRSCRTEQPHFEKWPANIRSRDQRVRGPVLVGTATGFQSHRCSSIPNPPGTAPPCSDNHQSAIGCIRRVAYEAADSGLLSPELAAGIRRVKGVRRIGVRLGNWLTADQGRSLLLNSQGDSLRSKRNYAILALLIGCGLRRGELLALSAASIQLREEHWVIADLDGKAGHIRTVPIPLWVKQALDRWTEASGIKDGCLFRAINKSGKIWGQSMTPKVLWEIVKKAAEAAGIEKLAPHDLRRTCARLCHLAGGELDQIQFLLGHVSIQTTEPRLQTEAPIRCERQNRNRTVIAEDGLPVPFRLGRRIRRWEQRRPNRAQRHGRITLENCVPVPLTVLSVFRDRVPELRLSLLFGRATRFAYEVKRWNRRQPRCRKCRDRGPRSG
jgi:integrase